MQFAKASLALSLAATAGLSGLSAISPATSEAAARCTAGTLLGRYTLKSNLTNQYVRAGIGSGAYVGAKSDRVGGNTSWETVDVYDLGNRNGLNGGTYALRSTQDPNRWVGVNNQKALQLQRGCTTNSRSRLFRANKIGRVLQLQSLANGQWVIQRSNGMLHANAATTGGNVPKALQFRMGRISSPSPSPTPAPGPALATSPAHGKAITPAATPSGRRERSSPGTDGSQLPQCVHRSAPGQHRERLLAGHRRQPDPELRSAHLQDREWLRTRAHQPYGRPRQQPLEPLTFPTQPDLH